jgi:hypothetical protein
MSRIDPILHVQACLLGSQAEVCAEDTEALGKRLAATINARSSNFAFIVLSSRMDDFLNCNLDNFSLLVL